MMEVKAYKDMAGQLHATRDAAAESDLILMVGRAWESMPANPEKGNPATIGRFLARNANALKKLHHALEIFAVSSGEAEEPKA